VNAKFARARVRADKDFDAIRKHPDVVEIAK
jgi:hypothetical protein